MLCNGSLDCTTQVLCENWQHFDLRLPEHTKKKNMLLVAHNGLRNRLASKLNMGDMLMMEWDDPLTELANRYHVHCLIHRVDDCGNETVIDEGTIYKMQHERVYGGRRKDIARNTFFLPINQIHSNFIELALVNWYFDHQKLPRPKLTNYETFKYYELIGDNNFTHMMCPQTYRIGCSYAKPRRRMQRE
ncbi:scoloptoxin SSD43-like [Scaptodrosophila lebanonensis]|uniref:Scoloptoxin SSD43-like n=1 Tax=Drosophila lebanonensis TaxID=7225 RepID=A0A6J2T232_DROLE|nr:scoloptoxin SSD43-like [Scaptodrosophila lebanonensis]